MFFADSKNPESWHFGPGWKSRIQIHMFETISDVRFKQRRCWTLKSFYKFNDLYFYNSTEQYGFPSLWWNGKRRAWQDFCDTDPSGWNICWHGRIRAEFEVNHFPKSHACINFMGQWGFGVLDFADIALLRHSNTPSPQYPSIPSPRFSSLVLRGEGWCRVCLR